MTTKQVNKGKVLQAAYARLAAHLSDIVRESEQHKEAYNAATNFGKLINRATPEKIEQVLVPITLNVLPDKNTTIDGWTLQDDYCIKWPAKSSNEFSLRISEICQYYYEQYNDYHEQVELILNDLITLISPDTNKPSKPLSSQTVSNKAFSSIIGDVIGNIDPDDPGSILQRFGINIESNDIKDLASNLSNLKEGKEYDKEKTHDKFGKIFESLANIDGNNALGKFIENAADDSDEDSD